MKNKFLYWCLGLFIIGGSCSHDVARPFPDDIAVLLAESSKQKELTRALEYFSDGDSLKREALFFLLRNMEHHYSEELAVAGDQEKAIVKSGFRDFRLKKKIQLFYDLDTISAAFLISHIEHQFDVWEKPWSKHYSFDFFCEYILPYRINTEMLEPWQGTYHELFMPLADSLNSKDPLLLADHINEELKRWFANTFEFENTSGKTGLQGPLSLLKSKSGSCPDMVNLAAYALRSVGLPAAVDFTPYWAASSGGHFWNYTFDSLRYGYSFMGAEESYQSHLITKELAKVYRFMFSLQPTSIAMQLPADAIEIEEFRNPYLLDVTPYYVTTANVRIAAPIENEEAYLCVFNAFKWRPVACAGIINDTLLFESMGTGVVYLPATFHNGIMKPLSNPLLLLQNGNTVELIPDKQQKQDVVIHNKKNYLLIRPNKDYKLYFWDRRWTEVATVNAGTSDSLVYNDVPVNCLLLMVPEYSQGKERIFNCTSNGAVQYW